jgi:predicted AlkP superfamily pyrophosphatase or phosphodiesterase
VNPLPGHEAEIEKVLLAPRPHMRCWRRADIPAQLHYGKNPRVPAIFCLGDLGWSIVTRQAASYYPVLHGNHGYDPAEPTMAALFLAHGPAFKPGVTLPSFDNVDVYPVLAKLIGVKPEPNDGHPADLAAGLR